MCLQRSPSVVRWPSGIQHARFHPPAAGNELVNVSCQCDLRRRRDCVVSDTVENGTGCVVIVPATTAPRARALAAACLALALLCIAARCYANTSSQNHPEDLPPRVKRSPINITFSVNDTSTTSPPQQQQYIVNSARVREYKAAPISHSTSRPMPSSSIASLPSPKSPNQPDKHPTNTVSSGTSHHHPDVVDRSGGGGLLALLVGATLLTATLGLITCVVSHYRGGGGGGGSAGGAPPPPPPPPPHHAVSQSHHHHHHHHSHHHPSCITAPMLSVMSASAAAGVGVAAAAAGDGGRLHRHVGMARELAAQRDRQVRLHSVHTDLELDLPPSIALPDGEELPYGSSARLHIRDPEQESEIYQKCIRPPPNRTVFESESPPPYRSSSAGLLGSLGSSSSSGTSDWSTGSTPLVVRCHSMSSSTKQHPHTSQPSSSQKTDFLQRTVKILTGRKSSSSSSSTSSSQQPPAPAPTLPVVVVPTRPRRLDPRSPHV